MKIIRYRTGKDLRLALWTKDEVVDLVDIQKKSFSSFADLLLSSAKEELDLEDFITQLVETSPQSLIHHSYDSLDKASAHNARLVIPLDPPEVWGCGVTYKKSRTAREFETGIKGIYDLVYDAERPEIFFKATASRCVGPNEDIGIRGDSTWSVPEAELAFVIGLDNEVVGFTAGDDVSARDIEGENPLYLPQAKIYDCCCALGPSIATVGELTSEPKPQIVCRILRAGKTVFEDFTNTSRMKRSIEQLRSYLCRYNPTPIGTVCLTGTGIVPPNDFSLQEGDIVEISIDGIGTLRNRVKKLTVNL